MMLSKAADQCLPACCRELSDKEFARPKSVYPSAVVTRMAAGFMDTITFRSTSSE